MIRFFISSTFQDMREERECIHRDVWPEIREYAREKGIYIEFCDLRWGININNKLTEKVAEAKIAEVCLEEIQHCKPYIITMLGDYYGSKIKHPQQIQDVWKNVRGQNYDGDTEISLTHWELEFAFLHDKNPEIKALCYFRDGKNTCSKMNQLKQEIRNKCNLLSDKDKIKICSNDKKFKEFLINEIKAIINKEAVQQVNGNWVEHEFEQVKVYTEQKTREFVERTESQLKFQEFLNSKKNFFGVYGKSGIGKSSLLSHLYRDVECDLNKCFIACGINSRSLTYRDVLLQVNYFIDWCIDSNGAKINEDIVSNFALEQKIQRSIEQYNGKQENETILIFIDAVDKLSMVEGDGLVFLLKLNEESKVKFVISQIDSFKIKPKESKAQEVELKTLTDEEQFNILRNGMFSANKDDPIEGKNRILLNKILSKKEAKNPLYLRAVIAVLKMHMQEKNGNRPSKVKLNIRLMKMPGTVKGIYPYVFKEAGEYMEYSLYQKVVGLIALSVNGLREMELEEVLGSKAWEKLEFIRFRRYLSDFFRMQSDGRWTFEHDLIKASVCRMIQRNRGLKSELVKLLKGYMVTTDVNSDGTRLDTVLREGFHLSMFMEANKYRGGYNLAIHLCKLCSTANIDMSMPLRGTIAQSMDTLLQQGDYLLKNNYVEFWYMGMVKNYSNSLVGLLNCLIELERDEEYEWRLPAMRLVERFLDIKGLKEEKDIQGYLDSIKSGSDQFKFCSLCAEYSSVLESIDEPMKAIAYINVALKYFLDYMKSDRVASDLKDQNLKERAKLAFTHANSMLYTNNKVMNLAKARSKKIIDAYQKEDTFSVKTLEQYFLEENDQENIEIVDALYNSNMGQFYNALEKYETAFGFHIMSVKRKIEIFMKKLPISISLSKWDDLFNNNAIESWEVNPHVEFWENMKVKLNSHLKTSEDSGELLKDWKLIATGYTTLGSDLYHFSNQLENFKDIDRAIRNSLGAWKIANNMINWTQLSGMEREQMQYGSRFLGSYLNLLQLPNYKLTDEEVHALKSIVQKLTDLYDHRRELFNLEIKNDLKEKMDALLKTDAINKKPFLYKHIEQCIHRLNNI